MRIHDILKKFFLVLIAFTILGLLSMVPMGKYQKAYNKHRLKYRNAPQEHVDATERYVEAIIDGEEDISKGIKARAPKKYYLPFFNKDDDNAKSAKSKVRKYDKPLYVRDKNNPKVLRPYSKKRFW